MKYIDDFRDRELAEKLVKQISRLSGDSQISLMEVCGTHTMSIFRSGIRSILPLNIKLISGPGCPVCVTPNSYIDQAVAYARQESVIIATFGDMLRVPGSTSSLEKEKSEGRDIRVVYAAYDALKMAKVNPDRKVVFLGVGFETTAPTVAASILEAVEERVENYFVFPAHKLIPPAMRVLIESGELALDGFICPGHVSTIIGTRPYQFICEEKNLPCVITGFEPLDVLQAIHMLIKQVKEGRAVVEIQYQRSVREEGNKRAQEILYQVFTPVDACWRGIGLIPASGMKINDDYVQHDAEKNIPVIVEKTQEHPGCICGAILRGVKTPPECGLFGRVCTPESPVGACMVSSEGTCAAYYKYGNLQ